MSKQQDQSHLNPGQYKMIICIRRKSGMSQLAFQDYWLNQHGPLAARVHADGLTPPMLGYIQNHTIDTEYIRDFQKVHNIKVEPYDGITEVWLNDPLDLDMGKNISDEVIAANQMLIEDEAKFVDLESSRVFIVRQHEIFLTPPQDAFYKLIICNSRLASLSRAQFLAHWLHEHTEIAASLREQVYAPPMLAYLQNHTIDVPMLEGFKTARGMVAEAYDGITEIWLNQIDDLTKLEYTNSQQIAASKQLLNDVKTFVDFSNSSIFMTIPHRIF